MIWLLLNFATILALGFYSMMEMAAVSFSKVRLHYYAHKGIKQAIWLKYLLDNPARLFGTTLIVVNIATVSGSEFAREFYESIGLDPDFSALTQVLLVVTFGELAPMFAARRYAEHTVMLGIPIIYFSAKLMAPFLMLLGMISKICNFLIGGSESAEKIFLSQEELLKIVEIKEVNQEDTIAARILNLHKIEAHDIMNPFDESFMAPSNITIRQAKEKFSKINGNYLVAYRFSFKN
ncbi:MAG TPA: CNNM domain-containing protein, partial [Parachlamydiaceae bacterium]|nr:CNNM domain-containing protein [Parachlamydiaceae bacterium]